MFAESIHYLVIILIPNSLDKNRSSSSSPTSYDVLINLKSKYRYRPHQETDQIPGLFNSVRGPNLHVEESWHDPDNSP